MGNIVLLDENTINKIAAGEVVDRPASIVKELVENSIDANAKNITVEIKNGGISYIKITDDGDGFKSDDVELAFERHATSKIRKESDILNISSMGFRGEALASVAAISKVSLVTRNKDEDIGVKLIVEAGNILIKDKTASNQGTTIFIKDVFYNTPARFKFLKKDYTEAGYIENIVIRLALSNPHIAFKYINNSKVIVSTTGDGKLNNVIYSIFGKDIYSNILNIDYCYKDIQVKGVIGTSQIARSTRNNEFTYINTRYVKDNIIRSALEKAFNENLSVNKFPFAVINVKINTETVDVNVHPAKLEVKFENEKEVFEAVYFGVKSAIENMNKEKSPFYNKEEKVELKGLRKINSIYDNALKQIINEKKKEKLKEDSDEDGIHKLEEGTIAEYIVKENIKEEKAKIKDEVEEKNILNEINITEKNDDKEIEIKQNEIVENKDKIEEIEYSENTQTNKENNNNTYIQSEIDLVTNNKISYRYIGQVFSTYILIEIEGKMYIIDQHAAHERLLYEKFKENFYSKSQESQILLIPIIIELKNSECEIIENNIEYFENCGFIIERFSDKSFKISGMPNLIDLNLDYKSMFLDLVDELMGSNKTDYREKEFKFLSTLACKAAVKGNMNLSQNENIKLIDEMIKLENPFTCPHGRPIAYEISKYEIERKLRKKIGELYERCYMYSRTYSIR